ncbi:MAG: Pelagibacter phage [Bacteroidota bacterium]|jgi:hypothetical protein
MPIPKRNKNEDKQKFVSRCMSNETMKKDYPDNKQRIAICLGQTRRSKSGLLDQVIDVLQYAMGYGNCNDCDGYDEELTVLNLVIPSEQDYIDFNETTEEFDVTTLASYMYKDPRTGEIFYYDVRDIYEKNGKPLVYIGKASEYQGKKVTLNKPFRTPDGPKKFSVYVKNEKGNVVKVNFGDPNMEIKKDIPARRKSFRARMRCETPGPKWKARYWACKSW